MATTTGASTSDPTMPIPDLRQRDEHPVLSIDANGEPELVGSRCNACGTLAVPERFVCPSCASVDLGRSSAGSTGVLYSFSVVHLSSSRETPYTLGYVDLDSGARILATIDGSADDLTLDSPVQLAVHADGAWTFTPVTEREPRDER